MSPRVIKAKIPIAYEDPRLETPFHSWPRIRLTLAIVGTILAVLSVAINIITNKIVISDDGTKFTELNSSNYLSFTYFVFSIILITISLYIYYFAKRISVYARAMHYLHEALHYAKNEIYEGYKNNNNKMSDEAFKEVYNVILNRICLVFSMVTGERCRACIKTLRSDDDTDPGSQKQLDDIGSYYVMTVARDPWSQIDCKDADKISVKEPLLENTPFYELILNPSLDCWIGNDLPNLFMERRFDTTSTSKYQRSISAFPLRWWRLPYRSAIAWPIKYYVPDGNSKIRGFLTIDCDRKNAFRASIDQEIGGMIADFLFILGLTCNITEKNISPINASDNVDT